jgi:hypothetical protein
MAEPKERKPAGATHEPGPEEPTRYTEQQDPAAAEEGEGGKSFEYGPEPEEELAEGEQGGQSFDYGGESTEPEEGSE